MPSPVRRRGLKLDVEKIIGYKSSSG